MGACNSNKKPKQNEQMLKVSSNNSPKQLEAKIVLIGNSGVGKTSIAQ
jgi:small GTP-binding protein